MNPTERLEGAACRQGPEPLSSAPGLYSRRFADWFIRRYRQDSNWLLGCRRSWRESLGRLLAANKGRSAACRVAPGHNDHRRPHSGLSPAAAPVRPARRPCRRPGRGDRPRRSSLRRPPRSARRWYMGGPSWGPAGPAGGGYGGGLALPTRLDGGRVRSPYSDQADRRRTPLTGCSPEARGEG